MKDKQVFYYNDELNDDFFKAKVELKKIDNNYIYTHNNIFYNVIAFIYYRLILIPIAFVHCKLINHFQFRNKKVLKLAKKTGYFVYGNHTNNISDAFSPSLICNPVKPYVIVGSQNMNLPVLKNSTQMLGAIPLPSTLGSTKRFFKEMKNILNKKHGIVIYPEAHIWPYYTKIRPFSAGSFKYPIKYDVPSFVFTTTYQKIKNKKFKLVIYVDGPFYINKSLSGKEQLFEIRDRVYKTMVERSKNSSYEKIIYKKETSKND